MKRLFLVLFLISIITITAFGLSGTTTSNGYFYLPGYGSFGTEEYNAYNAYMEIADNAIKDNETAIAAIVGTSLPLYYLQTEINTLTKVEAIYEKDIVDTTELATALGAYILTTEIGTSVQGFMDNLYDIGEMTPGSGAIIIGKGVDTSFQLVDGVFSDYDTHLLKHESGGLEADVSAYDGLVKITGGATSAVTDNSATWNNAAASGANSDITSLTGLTTPLSMAQGGTGVATGALLLLSTTTVSFAADADTTLYTVPTGKRCILTHVIVVAAADAGATTTLSIGADGAETDFIPANTLENLDAQYDSVILQPIPNTTPLKIKSYVAATVIEAQVAS